MNKTYLGDGAYVEIEATDTVYLEPSVYAALVAYVAGIKVNLVPAHPGRILPIPHHE